MQHVLCLRCEAAFGLVLGGNRRWSGKGSWVRGRRANVSVLLCGILDKPQFYPLYNGDGHNTQQRAEFRVSHFIGLVSVHGSYLRQNAFERQRERESGCPRGNCGAAVYTVEISLLGFPEGFSVSTFHGDNVEGFGLYSGAVKGEFYPASIHPRGGEVRSEWDREGGHPGKATCVNVGRRSAAGESPARVWLGWNMCWWWWGAAECGETAIRWGLPRAVICPCLVWEVVM